MNERMLKPEEFRVPNGPEAERERLARAERILSGEIHERKDDIEKIKKEQRIFIAEASEPLSREGKELVTFTKDIIKERFEKKFNQLAGGLITKKGEEFSGVQSDGKIGDVSACAERRTLFNFKRAGTPGDGIEKITAVRGEVTGPEKNFHYYHVVGPCALCRDAISSESNQNASVIIPHNEAELREVPIFLLYPDDRLLNGTLSFDDEKMQTLAERYREFLLSRSSPLTEEDNRLLEAMGNSSQEDKVVAIGRSSERTEYQNSQPKPERNPATLVVEKGPDWVAACDASDEGEQMDLLAVMEISESGKKVTLPTGQAREYLMQFHPLSQVIADFGKDGLLKLPTAAIYPMVYAERKRNKTA